MDTGMICTEFQGIFLNADTFPKGGEDIVEEKKAGSKKPSSEEFIITYDNIKNRPATTIPKISRKTTTVRPPIYQSSEFLQLSSEVKLKVLSEYHKRLGAARIKLAKQSLIHATFSDLISPTKLNSGNATPQNVLEGLETKQPVYTSRAGRQVKRKNYTEEIDMDSETEFVSQVFKKNKATSSSNNLSNPIQNASSSMKLTIGAPYEEEDEEEKEAQLTKHVSIRRNYTVPKKLPPVEDDIQTLKVNNNDQSKAVASASKSNTIPKRRFSPITNKKSRSETLFDNLIANNSKREEQEKKMAEFENSLKLENDEDFIEYSPKDNEEEFIKRRVQPPSGPPRKQRGRKKLNFQPLSMATRSSPSASTAPLSPTIRMDRDQKPKASESTKKVDCPICNRQFSETLIEDHAARCGEEDIGEVVRMNVSDLESGVKTCPHCQTVLSKNQFQEHEMHCVATRVANM